MRALLFCMALLHDNLDNREQANALYIKCGAAQTLCSASMRLTRAAGTTTSACS